MINATHDSEVSSTTAPDPSMEQLAPRPSRARNRLLISAAVVALVVTVFSPNILRSSVTQPHGESSGSWGALPTHRQVMAITWVTAQTWPRVDIRSIDDVRGAQLAGAWVVDESVLAGFDDTLDEATFDSGLSYITAAIPGLHVDRDALPQSLSRGDRAVLIALWNIDSCDALDVTPVAPARIETRTVIRTSSTENLPEIAAPGFDVELLRRTGACA